MARGPLKHSLPPGGKGLGWGDGVSQSHAISQSIPDGGKDTEWQVSGENMPTITAN
jgi:hypothetical protein